MFHLAAGRGMTEPTQPTGKHTDRVADLARRLGVEDARVWWRTPVEDGTWPTDLPAANAAAMSTGWR